MAGNREPMVIGLISSHNEGRLLLGAVRTAMAACDRVLVAEGPVAGRPATGPPSPLAEIAMYENVALRVEQGGWESDAAKRNAMLQWAKGHGKRGRRDKATGELWCVWIDADELLLYGEYLRDMIGRAGEQTAAGGFPLRIVELDGSVALGYSRVFRAAAIERYLLGSFQFELAGSGLVAVMPNVQVCAAGGVPVARDGQKIEIDDLAVLRPPLIGEPHLLHRAALRSGMRTATRLHKDEEQWIEQQQPAADA